MEVTMSSVFKSIPLELICVAQRDDDQIFYNPRGSFDQERLNALRDSICVDGLQTPLLVRSIVDEQGTERFQLIAGERRYRSCQEIVSKNLYCIPVMGAKPEKFEINQVVCIRDKFAKVTKANDDGTYFLRFLADGSTCTADYNDLGLAVEGSIEYQTVPCKVIDVCDDLRALRLAYTENEHSEPLSFLDEVMLIERLENNGYTQEQIGEMLGKNPSWVSQTRNFKHELPKKAFDMLNEGLITRHFAIQLIGYDYDKREAILEASIADAQREANEKLELLNDEKANLEDLEEIYLDEAEEAFQNGDEKTAQRKRRNAESCASKSGQIDEQINNVQENRGRVSGRNLQTAASGIATNRRNKMMGKKEVVQHLQAIDTFASDAMTSEDATKKLMVLVSKYTVEAVLNGISDVEYPLTKAFEEYEASTSNHSETYSEEAVANLDRDLLVDDFIASHDA